MDSELEEKDMDVGRDTNKGMIKIVQAWGAIGFAVGCSSTTVVMDEK